MGQMAKELKAFTDLVDELRLTKKERIEIEMIIKASYLDFELFETTRNGFSNFAYCPQRWEELKSKLTTYGNSEDLLKNFDKLVKCLKASCKKWKAAVEERAKNEEDSARPKIPGVTGSYYSHLGWQCYE